MRMRKDMRDTPVAAAGSAPVVVPFRDELQNIFEQLNREWIESYFTLEPADREILGDPREKIVAAGGEVFFVLEEGVVKGTCAIIRHSAEEYEIAKMAVAAGARRRGLGGLLMEACIVFARRAGAHRVSIVSNTVLEPALRLYRKHGFLQVPLAKDPRYERANIRLELELGP